jgi:hypothetical protein
MATEKLSKAIAGALTGQSARRSHETFSRLEHHLRRRDVARVLGYAGLRPLVATLRAVRRLVQEIEQLHPQVGTGPTGQPAGDAPNVEYPWEGRDQEGELSWHVPAERRFRVFSDLQRTPEGRKVMRFVRLLLDRFDALAALGPQ